MASVENISYVIDRGASSVSGKKSYSPHINILRGLCAISVLLFHSGFYFENSTGNNTFKILFGNLFGFGAVAVFFAISGYLMRDLLHRIDAFSFIIHRVVRIYPAYYAAGLLAWLAFTYYQAALPISPFAATLAPVGVVPYPLGVEWSLVYEMSFYIALTLLSAAGAAKLIESTAAGWLVVLVALVLLGLAPVPILPDLSQVFLSPVCIPFAAGMLIRPLMDAGVRPKYLLGLVAIVPLISNYPVALVVAGIASAVLVGCAIELDRSVFRLPRGLARLLDLFGTCSYGIYLCHVPVLRLFYTIVSTMTPTGLVWAAGVLLALGIGIGIGLLDHNLYRFTKRIIPALPRGVRLALAGVATALFVSVAWIAPGSE